MARRYASFFPQRVSNRVNKMMYIGNMDQDIVTATYTAITTSDTIASAGSIINGQDLTTAGSTTTFAAAYTASEVQMTKWGRCLTMVASGASTSTITIYGRDYLGSRMTHVVALNGTTAVAINKAFRYIDRVDWTATASVTFNLGFANRVGLPFFGVALVSEIKSGAIAANAGAITAGFLTVEGPGTTDVRGTYLPSIVVWNGSAEFQIRYVTNRNNLHGNARYYVAPS